ncbi:phosphoribosylaminoimidazole-succinocarboxamide synthase [Thermodesulfobium acidiphilum]|uniref:Phosphoribosylaminoimidazole-succinocarboxamide synthase n=1 Tax=Thermodesulfobium acidiphilum TaxID=1794699 RepID=A0A2R4VYE6_THEAF|nr:phosphoribosylaminoimidazolesuccinocarboxamide synthase [Thermodesulfobium acidiphilum]AWB09498.1 phosphoribosylaminoimidazole-succinocarboxamide synthase [Thermodesulfobium acidiphilum]
MELLYEGKGKQVFLTEDPDLVVFRFKDEATAFDGVKKESFGGKGEICATITEILMNLLEKGGVKTHFVKRISQNEMLVKRCTMLPIEVVVRNYSAGSIAKNLGLKEGIKFPFPIKDLFYKSDELHDPMLNDDRAVALGFLTFDDLDVLYKNALKVNEILSNFLLEKGIILADFKLEFGKFKDSILLADEITPDSMRLWDKDTLEPFDKDRFRFDLGDLLAGYRLFLEKITS